MKPRVLFVGRTRYRAAALARRCGASGTRSRTCSTLRVLASSPDRSDAATRRSPAAPRRALDGPLFWLTLPLRVRREARRSGRDAIVAQSPFEAAAALVARTGVPVIVELHGDWRTFARLYGSPLRRVARARSPTRSATLGGAARGEGADRLAVHRRGSRARPAASPAAEFPAFMDLEPFTGPASAAARAADGALHRRARAVQEHRRSRRGLAARAAAAPDAESPARRQGHAHRRRRVARARRARDVGAAARHGRSRRARSTRRACSSSRRAPRGWAAS